jgi:hypothetical protein
MIDVFNTPSQQQQTFTFYATGDWQSWNKPRGAKMIEIFCLGGGAGGAIAIVGTGPRSGGSGGGASGIVRGVIPAFLLPDTLYILVGKGGAGSTQNNTAGGVGGISYIGLQPSTSEQTLICKSSTSTPSNSTVGATISTVSLSAFGNLGLFTAIAGVGASTGGSNPSGPLPGASQAALATSLVTGGAGGGAKQSASFASGGSITSASAILTTQVNGGVTDAQNGDSGYGTLQPFCGTGGAGGAGRQGDSGLGGNGGNGWYGCGGGGAGASTNFTGLRGGNGGDGLVIITVIS